MNLSRKASRKLLYMNRKRGIQDKAVIQKPKVREVRAGKVVVVLGVRVSLVRKENLLRLRIVGKVPQARKLQVTGFQCLLERVRVCHLL